VPAKAQASLGLNNSDIRDMATMTDWLTRPRRSSIRFSLFKAPDPKPGLCLWPRPHRQSPRRAA
jgi:hypothetical protein